MKRLLTATLLAGCFAVVAVGSGRGRTSPAGEFETVTRYNVIGNAIVHYSWDHGDQLPQKLSDLVPGYISKENLSLLYARDKQSQLPSNWRENPQLIDTNSDCIYLGAAGLQREILVYENPDPLNPEPTRRFHVIPPGGGVVSMTASELKALLGNRASATLDRMRGSRVMYYEANLHAALNSYRLDFGYYPKGETIAVTGVLRGQNPTKKQYHSSYPQERNDRGEDLDPWGKPYWIESDGDTVRIKCATTNHVMCLTVTKGATVADDKPF
ncbi:MAG TPA: type II secretion system protein GspG [Verrucomicrobiae bacterium]|jgi:hypothetical protein|nr:type II secretion system protein GspG [Verrucomicrobiae bacterium]